MTHGPNGDVASYDAVEPDVSERLVALETAMRYEGRIASLEADQRHLASREDLLAMEDRIDGRFFDRVKWAVRQMRWLVGFALGLIGAFAGVWRLVVWLGQLQAPN